MELNLDKHISGQFNKELEQVLSHVLEMGGLVENQLKDALTAMNDLDSSLADTVIANDNKVNSYETIIDEECTRIIAKRQPAAIDLRLVLAIAKTIADLERIGDEICRIVKTARDKYSNEQKQLLVDLDHMGRKVLIMLSKVLNALARMDSNEAFEVYQMDTQIDKAYEAINRQLMTYMMEDPRAIPKIMDVMWATRSLERIGDRCQNISEHVIYFIKGTDVRHFNRDQIKQTIAQ
ncbi:phosphate transport system regulatory protein PhoU [Saccharobesus litoralis]|uniref:Phosphate-specific transport system accessory protein PhoU n=1 Tax=Saccharobesus litoralis TaxID=2172099 RepID=A0A2S0VMS1_9ALTE|nr:phosphate signaling complex protein PhoU [Saccharobesus litoralis]AWB65517.1 phosphate transport system regulatory protein PhoU [Saccharobesus litoralis]